MEKRDEYSLVIRVMDEVASNYDGDDEHLPDLTEEVEQIIRILSNQDEETYSKLKDDSNLRSAIRHYIWDKIELDKHTREQEEQWNKIEFVHNLDVKNVDDIELPTEYDDVDPFEKKDYYYEKYINKWFNIDEDVEKYRNKVDKDLDEMYKRMNRYYYNNRGQIPTAHIDRFERREYRDMPEFTGDEITNSEIDRRKLIREYNEAMALRDFLISELNRLQGLMYDYQNEERSGSIRKYLMDQIDELTNTMLIERAKYPDIWREKK